MLLATRFRRTLCRSMKEHLRHCALMLSLAALTSCGGSSNEVVPPPVVPPPPGPVVSGLDSRPSNTSCLAGDAPTDSTALAVERVFANLTFSVPVLMLQEPESTERWYVVQKTGLVYAFNNQADVSTRRVFIDLSGQIAVNPSSANDERGLLGMAFHPGYPGNPRVYLSYDANNGSQLVTRVVEYQTQDGGQTLAPSSARVVLQVYQPAANHNGGNIVFGPMAFSTSAGAMAAVVATSMATSATGKGCRRCWASCCAST